MVFVLVESVNNVPFDVGQQIQELSRARKRIETHQAQQALQESHAQTHKSEKALEQQRLDILDSYDKMGQRIAQQKAQGNVVDIEV